MSNAGRSARASDRGRIEPAHIHVDGDWRFGARTRAWDELWKRLLTEVIPVPQIEEQQGQRR